MPIHIIKNRVPYAAAEAEVIPAAVEKPGLFGWRVGRISVSGGKELQLSCPADFHARLLRRCYRACVRKAVKLGAASLEIPLLLPECRGEALRTALQSLNEAPEAGSLQIYLLVPGELPAARRRELAAYLESGTVYDEPDEPTGQIRCDALPCPAPSMPKAAKPAFHIPAPSLGGRKELERRLREADAGFSETLLKLIDKTGKKDSEIYNRANVSRQHFSKIRNNPHYKPTKPTALAFAIALELDLEGTKDLIGRAGYALTGSSKFDLIIMYFIEQGIYDLFEINEALYEFDQSLLGS